MRMDDMIDNVIDNPLRAFSYVFTPQIKLTDNGANCPICDRPLTAI